MKPPIGLGATCPHNCMCLCCRAAREERPYCDDCGGVEECTCCETCGGSRRIEIGWSPNRGHEDRPCPDCTPEGER